MQIRYQYFAVITGLYAYTNLLVVAVTKLCATARNIEERVEKGQLNVILYPEI